MIKLVNFSCEFGKHMPYYFDICELLIATENHHSWSKGLLTK